MSNTKIHKIAIDCRMYSKNFTGIGRYIDQLLTNLSKIDQQNTYLLYLNKPDFESYNPPSDNFIKILVNAPQYSLKEQTIFLYSILKTKPDLIHFTNFNQPILSPFQEITTIHDLTLHFYPGRKFKTPLFRYLYKLIVKIAIKKSKHIISISEHTTKDLHKYYPESKSKTQTIHNGFDPIFLTNTPTTHTTTNKQKQNSIETNLPKKYILYTGNWREHKNVTNLIKAFKILKEKHKYSGKLVLTGNPNPLYPEPLQAIHELKLQDEIIQLGLIEETDLPKLYQQAEVYVFPSLYEGFGLPILESFATQTPVAASNRASIPEVGGKGCLYFDPLSPEDIAEKTNQIISNPELKKQLIKKGQKQLLNFDFYKMAKETHSLYMQTLTNK